MNEPSNVAASVRQRLLNLAQEQGGDVQKLFTRYVLERFLYRLSRSPHRDRFVVKGAMLFVLWEENVRRTTRDLDLLGLDASAILDAETIIRDIITIKTEDDGVTFKPESITSTDIRENQPRQGIRVKFVALIGSARISTQVDIAVGDVVTPAPVKATFPVLLDAPPPILNVYPKESVVAEKFQIMVELGISNSRMKDFYDVWHLATHEAFEGNVLVNAIRTTFASRQKDLPERIPLALSETFASDPSKQRQWIAFTRRSRLGEDVALENVVSLIGSFLLPALEAAHQDTPFNKQWVLGGPWK